MPYFLSVKRHVASLREAGVFRKSRMESWFINVYTSFVECQLSRLCQNFVVSFYPPPSLLTYRFKWNVKTVRVANASFIYSKGFFLLLFSLWTRCFCHVKIVKSLFFVKLLFSVMVLTVSCLLCLSRTKMFI